MVDTGSLVTTRAGLQAVAEHVLSAALQEATGRIGLRPTPGGSAPRRSPPMAAIDGCACSAPSW